MRKISDTFSFLQEKREHLNFFTQHTGLVIKVVACDNDYFANKNEMLKSQCMCSAICCTPGKGEKRLNEKTPTRAELYWL